MREAPVSTPAERWNWQFIGFTSTTRRCGFPDRGEFAEQETAVVPGVVSRLGVADVRAFGLTWEDCEQLLRQLGYAARVDIVAT